MFESGAFSFGLPWAALAWPLLFALRRKRAGPQNAGQHAAPWLPLPGLLALPSPGQRPRQRRFSLRIALIWTLLVLAAMQPRWVGEKLEEPRSGRELMLSVDVSGSMEATDLTLEGRPANRLQVLQAVLGQFIERRIGDRLGMVLFGERAYLQAPLTFDRRTLLRFLKEAEIGLAGARRTAIGDGLAMALKHLQGSKAKERAVILITDGANNSGALSPDQALTLATSMGVRVFTIGVGAEAMNVRDGFFGTRQVNPSAELDETQLKKIAADTGGEYFRARDEAEMQRIYRQIDALAPAVSDADVLRPAKDFAHWPAAAALLLWGLAPLLGGLRRSRVLSAAGGPPQ